jgi:hypothetical protein
MSVGTTLPESTIRLPRCFPLCIFNPFLMGTEGVGPTAWRRG